MDPAELERLIDAELRRLPAPRAPRSLLPRVIAAVDGTAVRPWYTRAWLTWPAAWQAASVALLAAIVVAGVVLVPAAQSVLGALSLVAGVRGEVDETTRQVESVATAARVVWRALVAPVVPYALALMLLMCAACAVFGTALNHMVFGKALR
jgi:hypothetical protein